ncbi:MAG TPA: ParB/RepB/Spo0J family partition protein [Azospirillum sp.]|nr:ParB/RepB/Spo0J family partition protein [Azospirillum sp.]
MARKLDTSNSGLFKRALSRTPAGGGGSNSALFGLSTSMRHREIPLAQVEPDPDQPRRNAQDADIAALAGSIALKGLLQPINVREVAPDRFRIVAGERRYWAFRALERESIPALIIDTDDPQALALIENVQRVDLHPVELAASLQRLIADKGLVQEQAATLIGKSQEYVARLLGILRLPAAILDEAPGYPAVSVSLLMELAELGEAEQQRALWDRVKTGEGLTVKTVRAAKQDRRATAPDLPVYTPVLKQLQRGIVKIRELKDAGSALGDAERRELRHLRDTLDALLRD